MPNDIATASSKVSAAVNDGLHTITDSEMIAGLFTAIISFAEKVTGETLTVYVPTQIGEFAISSGRVRWSPKDPQAAATRIDHEPQPRQY